MQYREALLRLAGMVIEYLPEMKSIDRQGYRQREKTGTPQERPEEELPVMDPLFSHHTKNDHRFEERPERAGTEMNDTFLERFVFPQEPPHPSIIMGG
jgi:hypothetical protein